MIVILHDNVNLAIAEEIVTDLRTAFLNRIEVVKVSASSPSPWPKDIDWDDLLIVLYGADLFPETGNKFITDYLNKRGPAAQLLPVAIDHNHRKPPEVAQAIKALEFDESARGIDGRLIRRVGAMIGLRVQTRDNQIFISYRAVDGTKIAQQLEIRLKELGYCVWRDEAHEIDKETKILPGNEVQQEINVGLSGANLILFIDTPKAPESVWIKHEIDTANASLIPILPLCFRVESDSKKGPRFRTLLDLQRWVEFRFSGSVANPVLTEDDMNRAISEMETYLCEIFRRKCRVPFIVEKEFVSRKFDWRILDKRLLMFESVKRCSTRLVLSVLSHCSIFDQIHSPALKRFVDFLKADSHRNYSLYVYDGELLTEPQLREIIEGPVENSGMIILHHQELAKLLDSDFRAL